MMVKKMQETDTENEIREAYRVFDKERTGNIFCFEKLDKLFKQPLIYPINKPKTNFIRLLCIGIWRETNKLIEKYLKLNFLAQ